ncbi:MAG: sigma-70 family RNA polymerase sigma factor [Thomasclavelia sp.]|nr:sigma-70 family RNA polymerase sigma factor [Thomasclavelia sp.]
MEDLHQKNFNNVTKYLNGHKEAFEDLYYDNYKTVYFTAYNFFNNEEDAKDIVQDVFIKVSKYLPKLKDPKTFNLWIKKITYTTCLDKATKKQISTIDLDDDNSIDYYNEEDDKLDLEFNVKNNIIEEEIAKSLSNMTFALKSVAILRYYENLKKKEIAEILGIPQGTVASRLHKINIILQEDLSKANVTPSMFYSSIPFKYLNTAYILLLSNIDFSQVNSDKMITGIIGTGSTIAGISLTGKILIGAIIAGTAIGGGYAAVNSNKIDATTQTAVVNQIPIENKIEVANATITDVLYDTNYINHELLLDVKTSNNNYTNMLVNGVNTKTITSNGTYTITLTNSKDEVISSKDINITNIDITAPNYSYTNVSKTYKFSFTDDISGIDYNDIKYYIDGKVSNNYSVNSLNNTIEVNVPDNHDYKLVIYDKAGNSRTIDINY